MPTLTLLAVEVAAVGEVLIVPVCGALVGFTLGGELACRQHAETRTACVLRNERVRPLFSVLHSRTAACCQ